MVAEIREITSPPNGCWLLSIEWTATGCPDSRSSRVTTTVVVPRSNAAAKRRPVVSPGSTSIISSSTITAVTAKPDERKTPPSLRATSSGTCRSRASIASRSPRTSPRWASSVRSGSSTKRFFTAGRQTERPLPARARALGGRLRQLDEAFLHRRPQDHVAAHSHQRRLGPSLQRRHVHRQVLARGSPAGQPPAVAQLVGAERARVHGAHRHVALEHLHLALATGAVAAAGGVDGHAVPAGGVEDRRAARHPHLRAVGQEAQLHALAAVGLDRRARVRRDGVRLGAHEPAAGSWACRSRWAAIQRAPHSSWPSRRSAARTESTTCRAQLMIALVRPAAMAIGRNAEPSAWRCGSPNETLDAPRHMFR